MGTFGRRKLLAMPEAPRTAAFSRVPARGTAPAPIDGTLAVWWTTLDAAAASLKALRTDLDPATAARVQAMARPIDRDRTTLAHGLLRHLVAASTGEAPSAVHIVRRCESCGATDHGKPALATGPHGEPPALAFNLAHSGDVVIVALSAPGTPVGVDVESITPDFDWEPSRRHVFTDEDWARTEQAPDPSAARFALWARKEAAAKATGHGLSIDLTGVTVQPEPGGDGAFRARLSAPDRTHDLLVLDLALQPGSAAAVAVPGPGAAPRVTVTRADG